MKVYELFEAKSTELTNVDIKDIGDGKFLVSVKETKGPMVTRVLANILSQNIRRSRTKVFNKLGTELTQWPKTLSNGYVIKPVPSAGAEERLRRQADSALKYVARDLARIEKHFSPENQRKIKDAENAARKVEREKLKKELGQFANTRRVRITQNWSYGDDPQRWEVYVDSRRVGSNMSRHSAVEHVKYERDRLAREELAGKYSPEDKDNFIKRVLVAMKNGDDEKVSKWINRAKQLGYDYPEFEAIVKSLGDRFTSD